MDYVLRLCEELTRRMAQTVPDAVRRIRRAMPEYRVVDEAEHITSVREQYQGLFAGIAQRRGPDHDEVALARSLCARRAAQGLGLETVVGPYHLGCQQVWELLRERARRDGPDRPARLLEVVDLLWVWVEAVTSAGADGYSAACKPNKRNAWTPVTDCSKPSTYIWQW